MDAISSGQEFAVRAEGHAEDKASMSGERASVRIGGHVPDLDGPVKSGRGKPRPVGTEHHALNQRGVDEGVEFPAGLRIPYLYLRVISATDQAFAVGAEGHGVDLFRVSGDRE